MALPLFRNRANPQYVLEQAAFYASLTHSLVLDKGIGSPTFTNASAARSVTDNEGILRTAIAGEARFVGARRVRNLLTFTEDFSNAAWLKSNGGSGSVPVVTADQDANPISGVAYADKVVFTAPSAGDLSVLQQSFTGTTGSPYIGSFYVKAFAAGDVGKVILFRHAAGSSYTQVTLTSSYQRVSLKETGAGAVTFDIGLRPTFSSSSGTVSILLTAAQLENITGRTDQTTPSEYVSVGAGGSDQLYGVESAPVPLVSISGVGWAISGGNAVATASAASGIIAPAVTLEAAVYAFSFTLSGLSGDTFTVGLGGANVGQITANGSYTFFATALASNSLRLIPWGGTGLNVTVSNISVRKALYHGAGVDGVEYFDTTLTGAALPTAYTYDAVSLNGVAGTYVSTPDSMAASITGDIDIRVKAALTDWTPAAEQVFVGKLNAPNSAYSFSVYTAGALRFRTSSDGTAYDIQTDSTANPTVSDGSVLWVRVTRDRAAGEVKFYTSSDGSTWTQLGTTKTGLSTTAARDSTAALEVGSFFSGANSINGKIYQAQIYNGINGTLAVDFNAARYAGGTTLTGSTGETWTLQGNAVIHPTNYPNLGYLAEAAAENKCLQSNAFTTTWTAVGTPAATQNVIGPDGATSAWTLTDNDAVATEEIYQSITLTAATYTVSAFVKKTTGVQASYPLLQGNSGSLFALATIDTTNGVATAWTAYTANTIATGLVARCSSYNADYWRVEMSFTATAAGWFIHLVPAGATTPTKATGIVDVAAQGSAVFYGAQVELGSAATSYIPTTTVAVTRNADVLTYPSAGNISGTVGWCYAEWTFPRSVNLSSSPRIINTGAVSVPMYLASAASGDLSLYDGAVRDGPTPAYPVNSPAKSASTWGGSAATITYAGTSVTTAFDGDMNVGASIDIGCINGTGGFELGGTIRNVRIGQRQLSSSELQAITR